MTQSTQQAVSRVFAARGFAWLDECEPDGSSEGIPILDDEGRPVGSTAAPVVNSAKASFFIRGIEALDDQTRMPMFRELVTTENALLGALLSVEDAEQAAGILEIDERLDSDGSKTLEPEDLDGLSRSERAEIAVRMSQAIEGGLLQLGAEARMLGKKLLELRRRLFADSLRLVFKLSTRRGELLDFSTAILRGAVGLDTAIDRFDPDRGYQFSTYATWWIHQSIQRSRHDFSRAIRMPVHVAESTTRFWTAQQTIWARTGVRPPMNRVLDEIDAKLPPVTKLAEYRRLTSVARLDGHLPFGLAEVVLDPDVPTPMEGSPATPWVTRAFCRLDELVERLHSRKPAKNDTQRVEIFRARLALGLPRRTPLQELGDRMNVSRERIRQLETQVFEKVRARLFRKADFIPPWRWTITDD